MKVNLNGKEYEVNLNNLYKTREDNNLSTSELIEKYQDRIINNSL